MFDIIKMGSYKVLHLTDGDLQPMLASLPTSLILA
jgi:hypothetical protein